MANFQWRKCISKLRCSSHILQIEKGRHTNQPRVKRLCRLCMGEIETEDHLLIRCTFYNDLRTKYNITTHTDSKTLFMTTPPTVLGQFLEDAFEIRNEEMENRSLQAKMNFSVPT